MLVFAKEGRLAMEGFSLQSLLNTIRVTMLDHVSDGRVQFSIENQCTLDLMMGNEHALQGVIINLLMNALEAIQDQGVLILTVQQKDEHVIEIMIKDSGKGIDAVHLQRIFEPFFTTRINGTGLGLAVVDSVVKAHNGQVQCVSKIGVGTEFKISLPCIDQTFKPTISMGASA